LVTTTPDCIMRVTPKWNVRLPGYTVLNIAVGILVDKESWGRKTFLPDPQSYIEETKGGIGWN